MAYYKMTKIALFAALLALFWTGTTAQSSCTKTLIGLSPCLNYVTGNSSTPSSSCCSQLSNVVTSQPQCLCLLLNNTASSYGYNVNQTLALQLPTVCNVQTPPITKCNAANGPSASPDNTPQSPPSDSSNVPVNNIPAGSKSVPAVNGAHIGGSKIEAPLVLLLFVATLLCLLRDFEI